MSAARTALQRLDDAVLLIERHPEFADFESGASPSEVDRARELLGLDFPESYRAFLLRFGAGDFNGREFYGVIPGNLPGTSAPSAVWFTLDERKVSSLPHRYIVIGSSGYGSLFCLDTATMSEGEAAIIEWDKSPKGKMADDFGDFFFSEIRSSLATDA